MAVTTQEQLPISTSRPSHFRGIENRRQPPGQRADGRDKRKTLEDFTEHLVKTALEQSAQQTAQEGKWYNPAASIATAVNKAKKFNELAEANETFHHKNVFGATLKATTEKAARMAGGKAGRLGAAAIGAGAGPMAGALVGAGLGVTNNETGRRIKSATTEQAFVKDWNAPKPQEASQKSGIARRMFGVLGKVDHGVKKLLGVDQTRIATTLEKSGVVNADTLVENVYLSIAAFQEANTDHEKAIALHSLGRAVANIQVRRELEISAFAAGKKDTHFIGRLATSAENVKGSEQLLTESMADARQIISENMKNLSPEQQAAFQDAFRESAGDVRIQLTQDREEMDAAFRRMKWRGRAHGALQGAAFGAAGGFLMTTGAGKFIAEGAHSVIKGGFHLAKEGLSHVGNAVEHVVEGVASHTATVAEAAPQQPVKGDYVFDPHNPPKLPNAGFGTHDFLDQRPNPQASSDLRYIGSRIFQETQNPGSASDRYFIPNTDIQIQGHYGVGIGDLRNISIFEDNKPIPNQGWTFVDPHTGHLITMDKNIAEHFDHHGFSIAATDKPGSEWTGTNWNSILGSNYEGNMGSINISGTGDVKTIQLIDFRNPEVFSGEHTLQIQRFHDNNGYYFKAEDIKDKDILNALINKDKYTLLEGKLYAPHGGYKIIEAFPESDDTGNNIKPILISTAGITATGALSIAAWRNRGRIKDFVGSKLPSRRHRRPGSPLSGSYTIATTIPSVTASTNARTTPQPDAPAQTAQPIEPEVAIHADIEAPEATIPPPAIISPDGDAEPTIPDDQFSAAMTRVRQIAEEGMPINHPTLRNEFQGSDQAFRARLIAEWQREQSLLRYTPQDPFRGAMPENPVSGDDAPRTIV